MMVRRGLADLTNPSTVGVMVCDPTTDNACLLQQDAVTLQQQALVQQAAAIVAAQKAAAPPASGFGFLTMAAIAAAGYFAWKAGVFQHIGGVA